MGVIYDNYREQISELWNMANKLDKPLRTDVTWTYGIIHSRGDWLELQAHAAALSASIIICEDVVPQIVIAWDCPVSQNTMKYRPKLRASSYPAFLMSQFDEHDDSFLENSNIYKCTKYETRYVSLNQSAFSVNLFPVALSQGYRAKYLGMNYVTTPYGIITDVDTICIKPFLDYAMGEVGDAFCTTNYCDQIQLGAGFCIYEMERYRKYFLPYLMRDWWQLIRQDSRHLQELRLWHEDLRDVLTINTKLDGSIVCAEKFYMNKRRGNLWSEDTAFYHAWKGEPRANKERFLEYYGHILNSLKEKAEG